MRRSLVAVALAGCSLGGAALGAGGAALLQQGAPEVPSTSPVVARVPAAVLDLPQRAADLTGVPATPGLRRTTLHRVGSLGAVGLLLVGRDATGGRCIVAVAQGGLFAAGCVPEPAFASGGTRVTWAVPGAPDGTRISAVWAPDGTVRAGVSRSEP
jgi:hypothetical protein